MFAFQPSVPLHSNVSLNRVIIERRSGNSNITKDVKSISFSRRRVHMQLNHLHEQQAFSKTRRELLKFATVCTAAAILSPNVTFADSNYSTYKGPLSLGFSFNYPSTWVVKKKPIKTHLSEVIVTSNQEPSTTAGLVVDSVKIDAIDKFGSPEVVGQKVVDVETKKDSVKSATVQSAKSVVKDGLTYYTLDYVVDSSRGLKRYLAKATVNANQLYVFTAQAKVEGFEGETEETLSKMIDSFSVAKQYL